MFKKYLLKCNMNLLLNNTEVFVQKLRILAKHQNIFIINKPIILL